jgi:hypothetical protein
MDQRFSKCGPRTTGGPQAVSEEKALQKLYHTLNEWKNTPIHVCAKTAFVGWPSTERSFHNFLFYNYYFRKCFKLVYRKHVVTLTLTTGKVFLLFTCMYFWVSGILRRWSACAPTAYKVSAIGEILRNTVLDLDTRWCEGNLTLKLLGNPPQLAI